MNRRYCLKTASAATALPSVVPTFEPRQASRPAVNDDRATWIALLRKIADPVLTNLATRTLKARMPVEQAAGANRQTVTHLEAIGRLLAGLAPWIELAADGSAEGKLRGEYAE